MNGFLSAGWKIFGSDPDPQVPYDFAVVMPTVGRAEILDAVRSVYAQQQVGRVQILIGVDRPQDDFGGLLELLVQAPANVTPCLFYPGYSTSVRHGGLHPARDGGTLRSILTYLANARLVAYLDDDNWWAPEHLSTLGSAIEGHPWAYSLRWFMHPRTRERLWIDEWESVGPDRGDYKERFGGFVDPNCLLIDKMRCESAIRWWSIPLAGDSKAMSADRHVFHQLRKIGVPGATGRPTAYYMMQESDSMHAIRIQKILQRRKEFLATRNA